MTEYLIIFREPDGRTEVHPEDEYKVHQQHWKIWIDNLLKENRLTRGNALSLNGKVIKEGGEEVIDGPFRIGLEIIGGYMIIKAKDLDEAVEITKSCPVFETGGYAEVRETM